MQLIIEKGRKRSRRWHVMMQEFLLMARQRIVFSSNHHKLLCFVRTSQCKIAKNEFSLDNGGVSNKKRFEYYRTIRITRLFPTRTIWIKCSKWCLLVLPESRKERLIGPNLIPNKVWTANDSLCSLRIAFWSNNLLLCILKRKVSPLLRSQWWIPNTNLAVYSKSPVATAAIMDWKKWPFWKIRNWTEAPCEN